MEFTDGEIEYLFRLVCDKLDEEENPTKKLFLRGIAQVLGEELSENLGDEISEELAEKIFIV